MEIAVWNNSGCFFVERNDCYPKTNKCQNNSIIKIKRRKDYEKDDFGNIYADLGIKWMHPERIRGAG